MNRATFDKAVADDDLKTWILKQQTGRQDKWKIDSTRAFVINRNQNTLAKWISKRSVN